MTSQIDLETQRQLDEIACDIFSIGIVPRGFKVDPGKPLNGNLLMEAMKQEVLAIRKHPGPNKAMYERMTVIRDQYNRMLEVIHSAIDKELEAEQVLSLAELPRQQQRKILKKRRSI